MEREGGREGERERDKDRETGRNPREEKTQNDQQRKIRQR